MANDVTGQSNLVSPHRSVTFDVLIGCGACFLGLAIAASALMAQQANPNAGSDLPAGKEVFENYLAAIGGREKLTQLKSTRYTGTINISNMRGSIVIKRARPGMFSLHIELPKLGSIDQGTNGEFAWDVSPMQGARLLKGDESDEMIKRADFDEETDPEKYYKSIECTGTEKVNDVDCYVVEFTDDDDVVERRFYDMKSHLLTMVETKRGAVFGTVKTSLSDYKEFAFVGQQGGVKLPTHHEMTVMGVAQVVQFDDIAINVELAEDEFAPPAAVAKLIEKKNAREAKRAAEAGAE